MKADITSTLVGFLQNSGAPFTLLEHEPCRTSVESAAARASAGAPDAVGAKALVVMVGEPLRPAIIVLPGVRRLDGRLARRRFQRLRFATKQELAEATGGLEPGMVPPFGSQVFPLVTELYVDTAICDHRLVGFNASRLDRSVLMTSSDYLRICGATEVLPLSVDS
jgi:Ala-tRNA(Pro) deacylase